MPLFIIGVLFIVIITGVGVVVVLIRGAIELRKLHVRMKILGGLRREFDHDKEVRADLSQRLKSGLISLEEYREAMYPTDLRMLHREEVLETLRGELES